MGFAALTGSKPVCLNTYTHTHTAHTDCPSFLDKKSTEHSFDFGRSLSWLLEKTLREWGCTPQVFLRKTQFMKNPGMFWGLPKRPCGHGGRHSLVWGRTGFEPCRHTNRTTESDRLNGANRLATPDCRVSMYHAVFSISGSLSITRFQHAGF